MPKFLYAINLCIVVHMLYRVKTEFSFIYKILIFGFVFHSYFIFILGYIKIMMSIFEKISTEIENMSYTYNMIFYLILKKKIISTIIFFNCPLCNIILCCSIIKIITKKLRTSQFKYILIIYIPI